jgi:hypothetical protein
MYPNITQVKPQPDYSLVLTYDNKEVRQFDMKPLLNFGIFRELRDYDLFKMVHVCFDTVEWDNEADLDPEYIYSHSSPVEKTRSDDNIS